MYRFFCHSRVSGNDLEIGDDINGVRLKKHKYKHAHRVYTRFAKKINYWNWVS